MLIFRTYIKTLIGEFMLKINAQLIYLIMNINIKRLKNIRLNCNFYTFSKSKFIKDI